MNLQKLSHCGERLISNLNLNNSDDTSKPGSFQKTSADQEGSGGSTSSTLLLVFLFRSLANWK